MRKESQSRRIQFVFDLIEVIIAEWSFALFTCFFIRRQVRFVSLRYARTLQFWIVAISDCVREEKTQKLSLEFTWNSLGATFAPRLTFECINFFCSLRFWSRLSTDSLHKKILLNSNRWWSFSESEFFRFLFFSIFLYSFQFIVHRKWEYREKRKVNHRQAE
jgi:hypothetical protein